MSDDQVKFWCDEQLGKLARWLRIIGQDTEYEREIEDRELIRRAGAEGRIVLTRDRGLAGRAGPVEVVCLEANYPAHQLREVVATFRDRIQIRVFSRCVACNGEIEDAARSEVRGLVPPFVWETRQKFTRCTACKNIYWQATHRDRVEVQLQDVLGELYGGKSSR